MRLTSILVLMYYLSSPSIAVPVSLPSPPTFSIPPPLFVNLSPSIQSTYKTHFNRLLISFFLCMEFKLVPWPGNTPFKPKNQNHTCCMPTATLYSHCRVLKNMFYSPVRIIEQTTIRRDSAIVSGSRTVSIVHNQIALRHRLSVIRLCAKRLMT